MDYYLWSGTDLNMLNQLAPPKELRGPIDDEGTRIGPAMCLVAGDRLRPVSPRETPPLCAAVHLCRMDEGYGPLFAANPLMRSVADIRAFLADSPEWEIRTESYLPIGTPQFLHLALAWRDAAVFGPLSRRVPEHESGPMIWTDSEGYEFTRVLMAQEWEPA